LVIILKIDPVLTCNPMAGIQKRRIVEWRLQAFSLRLKGLDYREISERLGITPAAAQRLVKEQITALQPTREQIDEIRTIELGRLDVMTERLMQRIESDPRDDSAYSLMLKTSERRAKLAGLDAPKTSFSAIAVISDLPSAELKQKAALIMGENHGPNPAAVDVDPKMVDPRDS